MHNLESVMENETHKFLWDYEIQTDHLISTRRPDVVIINIKRKKRIFRIVDFAVSADHRVKLKKSENKDKYRDLFGELKKLWNMKDVYTNCNWCSWLIKQRIDTRTWKSEDEWISSKLLRYLDLPENWEESWRLEETYCHSNSNERPSANPDVKNSQGVTQQNSECKLCSDRDETVYHIISEGARGVMVIVVGNGHSDTSSNPGRDWLHFT